jgi:signal transduction histidine kinase
LPLREPLAIIVRVLQLGRQSHSTAFGIAVLAVAAATAARFLLTPIVGPTGLPYLLYFPAVAAVGLTGHIAASLLAALLSALVANLLWVSSGASIELSLSNGVALSGFLLASTVVATMMVRLERALSESAQRAREADERSAALEDERSKLQRESQRLALLADVASIGTADPTPKEVAQHAARRISEVIGEGSVIRVRDGEHLSALAWHHVEPEARPLFEAALLNPEAAAKDPHYTRLLETGQSVVLSDVPLAALDEGAFAEELKPLISKYRPCHALGAPIVLDGQVIGTLTAVRSEPTPYSEADRVVVEAVAARVSLAMKNARLFEEARREAEEARRARMIAEEASRVKDEFLATLSHELRTPLNAIVGWAHMLRDHNLPDDRRRTAVDTILRNAQSQEQLIADILEVQRIMAGKLRLEFRNVDLSAIVRTAAETVQPSAEAKQIKLQLLLDLDLSPIWGDPDRLQQVTWNLLSNAIKFTPARGKVRVRLQQTEEECEMLVEDNGPGIAPEFLPHVFERFRQADSSSTRVHKGLGLGLAISRNLIEMHGGSIEAANVTEPGRTGAVFTIRLPRHKVRMPATADGVNLPLFFGDGDGQPAWLTEGPSLQGTRVLVVDDDQDARELIGMILDRYGADVVVAASAEEAMTSLLDRLPHVVLTDIEMPHEDGYTFIRRVRALPPESGGRLPAAALTAYASAGDRMRVLAAGFNMHVAKPVQPAELATVIANLARS